MAQERFVDENPQKRNAVLEEFTGIGCRNCPSGHLLANTIRADHPGDVVLINIHQGYYANGYTPDLTTSFGNALASQASISSYPNATVNRHVFAGQSSMALTENRSTAWPRAVEEILQMDAYANVAAKATLDWNTRQVEITVQVYYTGDSPESTNYLNVAMLQDYILGDQKGMAYNPDQVVETEEGDMYYHMHALRHLLTGQWGEEITTTTAGSFVEKTYTYEIPESINEVPVEMENVSFVVFLTETHAEIITGCEAGLTFENGGPDYIFLLSNVRQAPNNTCDDNVRFSAGLSVRTTATPISDMTFSFDTPLGRQTYTHHFDPPVQSGDNVTIISDPLQYRTNKSGKCTVTLTEVNGSENFPEVDPFLIDFVKWYAAMPEQEATLIIAQDRYGEEITWKLMQGNDTLYSGGPYSNLSASGTRERTEELTLAEGCQTFTIYDEGGDGINNGQQGEGYIRFNDAAGNTIVEHDGVYTDSLVIMVGYNVTTEPEDTTANEGLASIKSVFYPNPASEAAYLQFHADQAQSFDIQVINNAGQIVLNMGSHRFNSGMQTLEIPVEKLENGVYFILIQNEKARAVQKMVIKR